jgi:hypothetical protein
LVTSRTEEGPQSPIEALRAKRDEVAARTETLIPLLEYRDIGLHVKYRLIGRGDG